MGKTIIFSIFSQLLIALWCKYIMYFYNAHHKLILFSYICIKCICETKTLHGCKMYMLNHFQLNQNFSSFFNTNESISKMHNGNRNKTLLFINNSKKYFIFLILFLIFLFFWFAFNILFVNKNKNQSLF